MLKRILLGVALLAAVAIILAWIASGGVGRIVARVKAVQNPFSVEWSDPSDIVFGPLPWQVEYPKGAPLYGIDAEASGSGPEADYESARIRAGEAKEFGNPSPQYGAVVIGAGNAVADSAGREYLTISALYSNGGEVSLSGWSLQSLVSGVRVPLPEAAGIFELGAIQTTEAASLAPGEVAVIASGQSPVGSSFRENICSGYLEQFQPFTPPIEKTCPSPREEMPVTAENLYTYGDACVDFVASLPSCAFYTGPVSASAPVSCDRFIGEVLSYNGCVGRHRSEPGFRRSVWRLFLGSPAELWGNTHDVIRLLDEKGMTVDVLTY